MKLDKLRAAIHRTAHEQPMLSKLIHDPGGYARALKLDHEATVSLRRVDHVPVREVSRAEPTQVAASQLLPAPQPQPRIAPMRGEARDPGGQSVPAVPITAVSAMTAMAGTVATCGIAAISAAARRSRLAPRD